MLFLVETCGFHLKEDGDFSAEDYNMAGEEEEGEEEQSSQHLLTRKKSNLQLEHEALPESKMKHHGSTFSSLATNAVQRKQSSQPLSQGQEGGS